MDIKSPEAFVINVVSEAFKRLGADVSVTLDTELPPDARAMDEVELVLRTSFKCRSGFVGCHTVGDLVETL